MSDRKTVLLAPLPALFCVVSGAFLGGLLGVAGGYGGARLRSRELASDLSAAGAEYVALDLRVKKLEGRETRKQQQQATFSREDVEAARLAQLLNAPKNGSPEQDDEAALLQKVRWP